MTKNVEAQILPLPDGRVDLDHGRVVRDGHTTRLTERERALLLALFQADNQTVTREHLLVAVWDYHPNAQTRAVDNAVTRLRKKIEADPRRPRVLLSEYGVGYRLVRLDRTDRDASDGHTRPAVRGTELADALAMLEQHGVVAVVGPAGIGKSVFADRVATQWADRNGCRVHWVVGTGDFRAAVARALGLAEPPGAETFDPHLERLVATAPRLLVVDGPTPREADLRELAKVDGLEVLWVRGRSVHVPTVRLGPLPESEAVVLLEDVSHAEGVFMTRSRAQSLYRRWGGSCPGTLVAAVRRARLLGWEAVEDDVDPQRAMFEDAWARLDDRQRSQLACLAHLEPPVGRAALALVLGFCEERSLADWVEAGWVSRRGTRFFLHDQVRAAVRAKTIAPCWREARKGLVEACRERLHPYFGPRRLEDIGWVMEVGALGEACLADCIDPSERDVLWNLVLCRSEALGDEDRMRTPLFQSGLAGNYLVLRYCGSSWCPAATALSRLDDIEPENDLERAQVCWIRARHLHRQGNLDDALQSNVEGMRRYHAADDDVGTVNCALAVLRLGLRAADEARVWEAWNMADLHGGAPTLARLRFASTWPMPRLIPSIRHSVDDDGVSAEETPRPWTSAWLGRIDLVRDSGAPLALLHLLTAHCRNAASQGDIDQTLAHVAEILNAIPRLSRSIDQRRYLIAVAEALLAVEAHDRALHAVNGAHTLVGLTQVHRAQTMALRARIHLDRSRFTRAEADLREASRLGEGTDTDGRIARLRVWFDALRGRPLQTELPSSRLQDRLLLAVVQQDRDSSIQLMSDAERCGEEEVHQASTWLAEALSGEREVVHVPPNALGNTTLRLTQRALVALGRREQRSE